MVMLLVSGREFWDLGMVDYLKKREEQKKRE